ncbi:Guanosine-diphosphatase [Hamiltosporidium tvaerminnensis]|nr:Guanosine-diphosphatase [Hamiltosporidium tvaerminnensis]
MIHNYSKMNFIMVLLYFIKILCSVFPEIQPILEDKGYKGKSEYVAVIDAGSTGTRLNIYEFLEPGYFLNSYFVAKSEPGLSTLRDRDKIEKTLKTILDEGSEFLDSKNISIKDIPISFQATAGLRMLSEDLTADILENIKLFFHAKQLNVKDYEIAVIDGMREGIYALESLIYLRTFEKNVIYNLFCKNLERDNKLRHPDIEKCSEIILNKNEKDTRKTTYGIIDMGGGSVQVALQLKNKDDNLPERDIIPTHSFFMYVHSFLGYGMKEVMEKIYNHSDFSYCLQKDTKSLETCQDIFKEIFIDSNNTESLKKIKKPDINSVDELYLVSYFYDILLQLNIDKRTTLSQIKRNFLAKCSFLDTEFCRQGFYLINFLDEYKLEDDKEIIVTNQIDGFYLNWSIGKALSLAE